MGLVDTIRNRLRSFLWLEPAQKQNIQVQELYDFDTNAFRNRMWVRGDPYELEQFFKNTGSSNANFWSSVPNRKIRKIHTGLPSMMTSVMSSIVVRDFDGVELSARNSDWETIFEENDFSSLLHEAIEETMIVGDGAFKISYDQSLSAYPILEYVPGDRVDFIRKRRKLHEIVFKSTYRKSSRTFVLYEHYGWGYIKYVLKDAVNGDIYSLDTLEETAQLQDVGFGGYEEDENGNAKKHINLMLAVPLMFKASTKWNGRGESLIDKKDTLFDAIDEVVSQWMDAVRSARPIKYVPSNMAPRDRNGLPMPPNDFDNAYISIGADMSENAKNQILVSQPTIPSSNYLESYISLLDLCLQGFMSPSTLGIDTKKLDNAEAQREKEKTTLYTRNIIIEALQNALPKLINATLKAFDAFQGKQIGNDIDVTINFGEYASPSFEALVEVLAKARTASLMSIETLVDELYGDSKDEEWKQEEVKRLKNEMGYSEPIEDEGLNNVSGGVEDGLFS